MVTTQEATENHNPTVLHFLSSCFKQSQVWGANPTAASLCEWKNVKTIQVYIFQMVITCLLQRHLLPTHRIPSTLFKFLRLVVREKKTKQVKYEQYWGGKKKKNYQYNQSQILLKIPNGMCFKANRRTLPASLRAALRAHVKVNLGTYYCCSWASGTAPQHCALLTGHGQQDKSGRYGPPKEMCSLHFSSRRTKTLDYFKNTAGWAHAFYELSTEVAQPQTDTQKCCIFRLE